MTPARTRKGTNGQKGQKGRTHKANSNEISPREGPKSPLIQSARAGEGARLLLILTFLCLAAFLGIPPGMRLAPSAAAPPDNSPFRGTCVQSRQAHQHSCFPHTCTFHTHPKGGLSAFPEFSAHGNHTYYSLAELKTWKQNKTKPWLFLAWSSKKRRLPLSHAMENFCPAIGAFLARIFIKVHFTCQSWSLS